MFTCIPHPFTPPIAPSTFSTSSAPSYFTIPPGYTVTAITDQSNASKSDCKGDLYKTEICHYWEEQGVCKRGEQCWFAHGPHELRVVKRHPKYKSKPCASFVNTGKCAYGKRCTYLHPTVDEDHYKIINSSAASVRQNLGLSRQPSLLSRVGLCGSSTTSSTIASTSGWPSAEKSFAHYQRQPQVYGPLMTRQPSLQAPVTAQQPLPRAPMTVKSHSPASPFSAQMQSRPYPAGSQPNPAGLSIGQRDLLINMVIAATNAEHVPEPTHGGASYQAHAPTARSALNISSTAATYGAFALPSDLLDESGYATPSKEASYDTQPSYTSPRTFCSFY